MSNLSEDGNNLHPSTIRQVWKNLNHLQDQTHHMLKKNGTPVKVRSLENANIFSSSILKLFHLILREKEILAFALCQLFFIAIGYIMFIQILDWIPDSLWNYIKEAKDNGRDAPANLVNAALLGWSFLVIVFVSLPIGILNNAIIAVHFQYKLYGTSSFTKALNIGLRNLWRVWVFTAMDAWITAMAILDRLPSKKNNRTAADELLYYAWKIGTFAVVPSLLNGRGFIEAGKEGIYAITTSPKTVLGIRLGYSLFCWVISIAAYIFAVYWACAHGNVMRHDNFVYNFYRLMIPPIFLASGIIVVLIRPFYLLCISEIYVRHTSINKDYIESRQSNNYLYSIFFVFMVIAAIVMSVAFFADSLGIRAYVEQLAHQDLQHRRQ